MNPDYKYLIDDLIYKNIRDAINNRHYGDNAYPQICETVDLLYDRVNEANQFSKDAVIKEMFALTIYALASTIGIREEMNKKYNED